MGQVIMYENTPATQRAAQSLISHGVPSHQAVAEALKSYENLSLIAVVNKEERNSVHSGYMELRKLEAEVKEKGKAAREDANAFAKAVIELEKKVLAPISSLKEALKVKRDAFDEAEKAATEAKKNRLQDIKDHIQAITEAPLTLIGASSAKIEESLALLKEADTENQAKFGEFTEKAKEEQAKAIRAIEAMLLQAKTAEEQAAQLAEIKRQQVEIERKNLELAEQQAKAEKAKQEAESSKLIAEKERAETEARFLREAEAKRLADEAKAEAEAEEQARKAALMPDKQKIISFADGLVNWSKTNAPALEREEAGILLSAVLANIEKMAAQIKDRAGAL